MSVPAPHFLLRSRASRAGKLGRWSFALQSAEGAELVNIEEIEPETSGERLELLALVRGLEALPQPARVTVRPASTYVQRVLNSGLDEWRDSDWQWERDGQMVPVKNADLWRRIDRALQFHQLNRCGYHSEKPQNSNRPIAQAVPPTVAATCQHQPGNHGHRSQVTRLCSSRNVCRGSDRRRAWAQRVLLAVFRLRRRAAQRWEDFRAALTRLAAECAAES